MAYAPLLWKSWGAMRFLRRRAFDVGEVVFEFEHPERHATWTTMQPAGGEAWSFVWDAVPSDPAPLTVMDGGFPNVAVYSNTTFVYDGPDVVEERLENGTRYSFVHGLGVDEHVWMDRFIPAIPPVYGDPGVDPIPGVAGEPGEIPPQILVQGRPELRGQYYFVQDALGSVVALMDRNGAVVEGYLYTAYGSPSVVRDGGAAIGWGGDDEVVHKFVGGKEARFSQFGNPYAFTGQRYDAESSLYYYRARYYDPAAGRFQSRDPLGAWTDPVALANAYAYVGANPLLWTDSSGTCPDWICRTLGVVGHAVVGVIVGAAGAAYATVAAPTTGLFMMAGCVTDWSMGSSDLCDGMQSWWWNEWIEPVFAAGDAIWGCVSGAGSCDPCAGASGWDRADCYASIGGQIGGALLLGKLAARTRAPRSPNLPESPTKPPTFASGGVGPKLPAGLADDLAPTIRRIESGGSYPYVRDGTTFYNREGLLPLRPAGYYTEYVHPTKGVSGPGAQRIVTGQGGDWWYTPDHYKSFTRLR